MSSNQQLLVIGSIFLLSMLILNFYSSSTNQMSVSVNNEAIISATGIAQAMIDNIQTRAFDEATVSVAVTNAANLTASANLGPDAGEVSANFYDDVDDFNNYSTIDSSTRLSDYTVNVIVNYIVNMNPASITASKTFAKRVDVSVISQYLPDTLTLSQVIAY